jgi:hypothetical protein
MSVQLTSLRRAALLLFLIGLSSVATAQPNDEFDFDEIPLDEGGIAYIGVGAGYVGMLSFMNFDALNTLNHRLGFASSDDFKGPLLMHGGGGWTVIGLIPNLRLGVYGAGGSTTKSRSVAINGTDFNRTVRFDVGFTAAHIDYAIPLFRGFAVVPGVMVGSGSNTYKVVQTQSAGANIENFLGGYSGFSDSTIGSSADNRSSTMTRSFLFVYPAVNLEYAITQFVMVRAGGGYQFTNLFNDPVWFDTEGTEIANVPDIKSNGPMVQVGIFLGLFQQ